MSSDITHAAVAADTLAVAPNWRREVCETLILTIPIAGGLLAEMGMGVIDYKMAGELGDVALGAASYGLQLIFTVMFWGMGAIAATGAVGAQAHGADDAAAVSRSMQQGFVMATLLSVPIIGLLLIAREVLPYVEDDPEVVRQVRAIVLYGLGWVPLAFWFTVLRNFVTVMRRPTIVTVCAIAGLPLAVLLNYIFMYGNWGAPAMGAAAVGMNGTIIAVLHLVMIVVYVQFVPRLRHYRVFSGLLSVNKEMMRELFHVGIPIALAYLFETGLFFVSTVLMGIISTQALAAHSVVLNVCAVSFMVPYALSQAATVRVGYAVGAGQLRAARRAGDVAVALGIMWMLLAAAIMWFWPRLLTGFYLDSADPANQAAIVIAIELFVLAAIFQVVDGTQVTTQGALRGLKDTKVPMIICGLGYWVFGLGSGVALAFLFDLGAIGLWYGLAIGLAVSAALLLLRWRRLSARLVA
ncbi:MATE family efflux transporter [Dongia deserti]|uniref:MATE family efflux transporter n=1 Tax=Dongia deserti TaxID=2268030 RepID=UPI000E64CCA3|nr:MATE family efflux transporter [Dongia deserti]